MTSFAMRLAGVGARFTPARIYGQPGGDKRPNSLIPYPLPRPYTLVGLRRSFARFLLGTALWLGLVLVGNGAELIANGGVEQIETNPDKSGSPDGYPSGWRKFCEDPLAVDVGALQQKGNPSNSLVANLSRPGGDDAHEGKKSLWVNIPGDKTEIGGWATRVAIKPKTLYRFSCWAKTDGKTNACVALNEFKADGKTRAAQHTPAITSDRWQKCELDFESSPETVGIQIVGVIWQSTGQAWFDDFSLQAVDFSTAAAGDAAADETPFTRLTTQVVTPHIAWANPSAMGPIKMLAIPADREVVELAQRLSLDFTTWRKFSEDEKGAGNEVMDRIYHGPRKRGNFASLQELKAKLGKSYDVILVGTFDWPTLPEVIRKEALAKVQAGAGLVFIRPPKDRRLESFKEKPVEIPPALSVGIPYAGLTVLDLDAQGKEWLKCFTCGKGRVAIVDYQNEKFGFWECERSFRRGQGCPFTPDVTYDYRAKPLYYEYYQSLLVKLVLWASQKEGAVTLTKLFFADDQLQAEFINGGAAQPGISAELVVRDPEGCVEVTQAKPLELRDGRSEFKSEVPSLKAGPHFADLWLKKNGKVLAWGSAYFKTTADIDIASVRTTKRSYPPAETVEGTVTFSKELPETTRIKLQFLDSLGRLLDEKEITAQGEKEVPFQFELRDAVAILHHVKATLLNSDNRVVCEKSANVMCRRPPLAPDDYQFWFWASNANNNLFNRYALQDFYRRGFDVAYCGYLYAQPADQLTGCLQNTVRPNLNLGLFAFSLACWDAGSDPTATVSPRCLTAQPFRENLFRVLRQHASVARDYPVYAYSLGDETGIGGYGQDFCFSPTCQEFTRNHLKSVYGDLAKLNQEWGAHFAAWDQVKCLTRAQAKENGNIVPWVDLRMAMEEMFAALLVESGEALRKEDPDARVGHEGMQGGKIPACGEDSFVGYDFGKIVPRGNFWGPYFHYYPGIEFIRSFAAPNTILQTYTQPFEDYPKGYYEGIRQNEKVNRFVPWYDLFHGMNSTCYWGAMTTTSYGFYSPDYRPAPWAEPITETIQEIKRGIGMLLVKSRRRHDRIAIHYSPASFHVETFLEGKERMESPRAFCHLLEDLGLQYDFISQEQMAQGKLNEYKVLILPYSRAIDAKEAQAIRQFAERGGALIADGEAGTQDGHGKIVKENMLAGLNVVKLANPVWKYLSRGGGDHEVRHGEGGGLCRKEIRAALEPAGVKPRFKLVLRNQADPVGYEMVRFTDGEAEYLGILQGREYLRKEKEDHTPAPATIGLPRKYHVYSVRDGNYLGFVDKIETTIEPAVAKLYALLPGTIKTVDVRGLEKIYHPGQEVKCEILTSPKLAIPHVFHIEVTNPTGQVHREYTRNVYGKSGEPVTVAFPFALNDSLGKWKVVVTEVASGIRGERLINLQSD
ncbi:MAG: beta-galactosidase trimerization domain-containing protein [Verrucomicrobia bacterium]|nr:beta-galactosidase trimerization domain-containing protein [Verrucomicrobiota bacterium]